MIGYGTALAMATAIRAMATEAMHPLSMVDMIPIRGAGTPPRTMTTDMHRLITALAIAASSVPRSLIMAGPIRAASSSIAGIAITGDPSTSGAWPSARSAQLRADLLSVLMQSHR